MTDPKGPRSGSSGSSGSGSGSGSRGSGPGTSGPGASGSRASGPRASGPKAPGAKAAGAKPPAPSRTTGSKPTGSKPTGSKPTGSKPTPQTPRKTGSGSGTSPSSGTPSRTGSGPRSAPGSKATSPPDPRRRVPRPTPAGGRTGQARGGPGQSGGSGGGSRPQRATAQSRPTAQKRPASARPTTTKRAPRPRTPTLRLGSPRPRLRLVSLGLALILLVFVVRLFQVQAVDAGAYAAKANVNRYVPVKLAAERGAITDRDGVDLATTVDAYDITADPSLLAPDKIKIQDAPRQAAALLAPILHEDRAALAKKLATPGSRYVRLSRQQTPQVWKQIKDLRKQLDAKAAKQPRSERRPNVLVGIFADKHSKRVYPNKDLASGVLGFVNSEGRGGGGLEARLDRQLAGKDGKLVYAQSGGRRVPTAGAQEHPAVPGTDVELTLDRDIQWMAQQAITKQVAASQADRGYVVVQDTKTGEILALANAPGFDPNDISKADPEALGNAALTDAFEPGSTSKLMSMAAVLEEGVATPATRVTVPNRLHRGDRNFADDIDHPTWHLTLNGVLAKSSNIGTILATEQLGRTRQEANRVLHSYLRKFGLGQPTGLGFPGETPGLLAPPQKWSTSQQYTIPFGQGLSLNAVQAASVYSAIANGGERIAPTLIRGTTGPDGRYRPAPQPPKSRVVSEKTARTLATMLESVVDDKEGTGAKAKIDGYRVGGKTGTSNRVDPKTGRYHGYTASFAGFAPADQPRITVYCAVQNPTRGSYFGGQVCGPIYQQVMEFALKTLQVPPSGAQPPRLPVTFKPGE
ncbi:peptidoglycan D,D-transpeptidase FtsI family protein [Streptomyces paromomycinus]|uniref:Cell division protein n=1 Tax=Streptomyces paromomycinus TaxID=92743 RepID=A0A401WAZ8_STREY|nr:penicillin-binding protein 2 [Streptomyces paromomycinus]GCD46481.1 cell division protein [Streptomyces paromomycinus]